MCWRMHAAVRSLTLAFTVASVCGMATIMEPRVSWGHFSNAFGFVIPNTPSSFVEERARATCLGVQVQFNVPANPRVMIQQPSSISVESPRSPILPSRTFRPDKIEAELLQMEQRASKLKMMFGWYDTEEDTAHLDALQEELTDHVGHLPLLDQARIACAVDIAYFSHNGQRRKSGQAYITHPIEVMKTLADLGMDSDTLLAALLHDTVEDTYLNLHHIEQIFGSTVRNLVEGETKISKLLAKALVDNDDPLSKDRIQDLNFMHTILCVADDWRVLAIKLADRLHNLNTVDHMSRKKQIIIAQETLDVYVPLADCLGIQLLKHPLQQLAFQALNPRGYLTTLQITQRRQYIDQHSPFYLEQQACVLSRKLEYHPTLRNILSSVEVRPVLRDTFSLWRRLERSNDTNILPEKRLGDITILQVVFSTHQRVQADKIVDFEADTCYKVLGVLHDLLPPAEPLNIKDYVAFPKVNGYQAIHSRVLIGGKPVEVQVCSDSMDVAAMYGVGINDHVSADALWEALEFSIRLKAAELKEQYRSRSPWSSKSMQWDYMESELENIALAHAELLHEIPRSYNSLEWLRMLCQRRANAASKAETQYERARSATSRENILQDMRDTLASCKVVPSSQSQIHSMKLNSNDKLAKALTKIQELCPRNELIRVVKVNGRSPESNLVLSPGDVVSVVTTDASVEFGTSAEVEAATPHLKQYTWFYRSLGGLSPTKLVTPRIGGAPRPSLFRHSRTRPFYSVLVHVAEPVPISQQLRELPRLVLEHTSMLKQLLQGLSKVRAQV